MVSVKGFTNTASFNRVKSKFTTNKFGGRTWEKIFETELGSLNYHTNCTSPHF